MPQAFCIADQERVEATLDRLARQIHATLPSDLVIVGIRRRGVPLAQHLAGRVENMTGSRPHEREVTVKRYADDLTLLHKEPRLDASESTPPIELRGQAVLLVDDVLFSGHTLLRVLQRLRDAEPADVRVAVLCARDTQEVPRVADFVGMQLDVGPRGVIDVHAPPYEDDWSVWLSHSNTATGNQ
ncbi:MAG: phosphoribosyltransferase family protein [Pirellulaceae bacterium]